MIASDFHVFARELALVAETFGATISSAHIEIYFRALNDLPLEQVRAAMDAACRRLRFFPKPVELRELITGSPDERAERAWTRVRQGIMRGVGGYRLIDFGDMALHATIDAMGGWARFYSLGFRGVEEVAIATARKEFLQLYSIFEKRGAPASTPAALCAASQPVFAEPLKLGDGFTEPVVLAPPPAAVVPAALEPPKEPIGPERVRELRRSLAAHHRLPASAPRSPAPGRRARTPHTQPSTAKVSEPAVTVENTEAVECPRPTENARKSRCLRTPAIPS